MLLKKTTASILSVILMLTAFFSIPASAWNASPSNAVDMTLKLVGMMNMKIFQDSPYITNVSTVSSGELSGKTLYCYKFSGTGTSIGKNWPHQMGDGPYTEEQFQTYFGVDAINECMTINKEEVAVMMLYDLGDPNSQTVIDNMRYLGITDINVYYKEMAKRAALCIDALPGGGSAHECAITAYYRYSDDWRSFASSNSGKYIPRATLESMGIAAPNENRYFFETKDSQKMIDGGDAFPGVFDESVAQYIDENATYSLPVWEDTNENASWNIVNPVPTCNIYSRWYDDFSKDSTYDYFYNLRTQAAINKFGESYTQGQWNGYLGDTEKHSGVTVDNGIMPKNWEWRTIGYDYAKSNGVYSQTTASKSHLGYGEYCPAGVTSSHWFNLPENLANDDSPSRFLTVMVRETGTVCGLDGCGHWHSVQVNGKSATNIIHFEPEVNDDSVVIDYGLSVKIPVDANDWVWTTDATNSAALPNIADIKLSAGDPNDDSSFSSAPVKGKYGTLELDSWSNTWGEGGCIVKYTPKKFVNEPDVFYYKLYPVESDLYQPMVGKVSVIPASLVYYEDSFSANDNNDASGFTPSIEYSGNWSYVDSTGAVITGTAVNGSQSNANENYGYDDYYATNQGFSDGSAHSGKRGDSLSFTFKGTGCDVIMRTDAMDGSIRYSVTKSTIAPDGSSNGENTEATPMRIVSCRNNNNETLYQLPVVSLRYDDYAYYTVTIDAVTSRNVYIDGIRLYNPLGAYGEADSDNATMDEFYNIADRSAITVPVYKMVYDANNAPASTVGFLGVYNNWNEWYGVNKDEEGTPADYSTLMTIGPNNEVYLAPGQSLVFSVANAELADLLFAVEAKTLSGSGVLGLSVDGNTASEYTTNINSNTAMYYPYDLSAASIGSNATIRIENRGTSKLSISNLKYSKVLTTKGKIDYTFTDSNGIPMSGVTVTVRDSLGNTVGTAVTDSTGKFVLDELSLGKYKAYFSVPENMSTIATRDIEVSEYVFGESKNFALYYVNTTIGSHPSIFMSPSVELTTTTATFKNYETETPSGSYVISYHFDGVAGGTGYTGSTRTFLTGDLVLTVNANGTATYKYNGTGKTNGKSFASSSGTTSAVTVSNGVISVDYVTLLKSVTGQSGNDFKFTDITAIMPTGSNFAIEAFELENASIAGNFGPAANVTVGREPTYTSTERATVSYTFKDEAGNPIPGVSVTIGSDTLVSDAQGAVTFTNVLFGESTAHFTSPAGLSAPANDVFTTNPTAKTHSREYTLYPFDLTLGSYSYSYTPRVTVNTDSIVFSDLRPTTMPGSYKVTYNFKGSSGTNGYIDRNSNIAGTLTLTINSDGTVAYNFSGSGKTNGKGFSSSSGTFNCTVDSDFSTITIPTITLMQKVTGKTDNNMKFTDATVIFNSYSDFGVTAYENANATGTSGNTASLAVAAPSRSRIAAISETFQNIRQGLSDLIDRLAARINGSKTEDDANKEVDDFVTDLGDTTEEEQQVIVETLPQKIVKFVESVMASLRSIFGL